jgi:hypothetical protein
MKEIDFIPKWYKNRQRRQMGHRAQYAVVGIVLFFIAMWNFITQSSVSSAKAALEISQTNKAAVAGISEEYAKINSEIRQLQKKKEMLKQIDSRITVSSVLAEVGVIVNGNIVLNEISLRAEKIAGKTNGNTSEDRNTFLGDVKFKISINGIALNPSDVANLICDLENSPYFCNVIPAYSRNRFVLPDSALGQKHSYVTEFSLDCYLNNYREKIVADKQH